MGHLEHFLDFRYKVVEVLDEQNRTALVRDQLTDRFLVRRTVPAEAAGVYEELKNIRHQNLVQILEVYRLEGVCAVLEEYVNGCSIKELLEREKKLGEPEAKGILMAVCRGLFVLHEKGLVCRNIRPDTIRINQDGIVKLMDFAEARQFLGEKSRDTVLIGPKDYAAPEQYGFSESDGRADIYAAGILLNELLTGKLPRQRMYRKDRELRRIIRTCVQVDKRRRYENVKQLMQALEGKWGFSEKEAIRGKKTGLVQRFYGGLPGLRSDAWYRKALALVGYDILILLSYLIIVIERETSGGMYVLVEVMQLLVPAALVFNAWNCTRLSLLPRLLRPHFRVILAAVSWFVLDVVKGFF